MAQTTRSTQLILMFSALFLGACQGQVPIATSTSLKSRGHAMAMESCGACHAVDRSASSSPNPDAPPFAAIVNKEGLTAKTLSVWLRDAHNYPDEMQFELQPDKADDLVTYMLTLKDPDYRPAN